MPNRMVVFISGRPGELMRISALELMSKGFAVICAHPWIEYAVALGYGAVQFPSLSDVLIERCDAVLFTPDWEDNPRSLVDGETAERYDRECFYSIDSLVEFFGESS